MLGSDLRTWFGLFDSIVIYRPNLDGGHESDGWINWSDIERRFISERLQFNGKLYTQNDAIQHDALLDTLIHYANVFVMLRLLKKRRLMNPPSLDYKLTVLGRRVGNWGYAKKPGFKKSAFFFISALFLRVYRCKIVITMGAAGWAIINALKFYDVSLSWISNHSFAAWSAASIALIIAAWEVIKAKFKHN